MDEDERAIRLWNVKRGPCVGHLCIIEDKEYRIAKIADGIAVFADRQAHRNRFRLDKNGDMHFLDQPAARPTVSIDSLEFLQGAVPMRPAILPSEKQDLVRSPRFKVK
ncbi:hypothetical protein [Methyloligella solikamskensis]|uniref:Uncharacterized protein n=1 Tax=Methyloligella solikamskensis TaxID=1177756 RepID=A0ABW3JC32_9HYPH